MKLSSALQKVRSTLRGQSQAVRLLAGLLIALGLFGLGVAVGDGRIQFGQQGLNNNLPGQLDYSSVTAVYQALKSHYNGTLTTAQLLNGLKSGLAESTNDPYTEYFTAAEAKAFTNELNNAFSGVGVELGQNAQNQLIVVSPIQGSPAAKAGLQSQDIITSINGQSTANMAVDTAAGKVRGVAGTVVTLGIQRGDQQLSIKITRQNIHTPSVSTKLLSDNIGYIQIISFGDDTATLMDKAAMQLQNKHVKSLILDLRDNPGGEVSAATSVVSHWLPEGKLILQEKRGSTVLDSEYSQGTHELNGLPTVVLINGGSASAAEITAAGLHDNKAAYLVGEKSFGKGVVQQIVNFKDGSELKVTIASWYRPNGQNINHKGIIPDKTITMTTADVKAGNDTQLTAAEQYLQTK
jgi:carboxyl-terminal processing protease